MKKSDMYIVCCVLAAGFLFCIFLPKAQYSDSERRKLASMPTFQAQKYMEWAFYDRF